MSREISPEQQGRWCLYKHYPLKSSFSLLSHSPFFLSLSYINLIYKLYYNCYPGYQMNFPIFLKGALFGGMSAFQTACTFFGSLIFSAIYRGTIYVFKGTIFLLMAGMFFISLILTMYVVRFERNFLYIFFTFFEIIVKFSFTEQFFWRKSWKKRRTTFKEKQ